MTEVRRGLAAAFPKLKALVGVKPWREPQALIIPREPVPTGPDPHAAPADLSRLAADLEDGASCPAFLLEALQGNVALRRARTGTLEGPASPLTSGLSIRRSGLPGWWEAGGNLLLVGPDAIVPEMRPNMVLGPPQGAVLVLGARAHFNRFDLGLEGSLIVIGDDANCRMAALTCRGPSTVLIGEGASATMSAQFDCRNGGVILVGPDAMWAHGVNFMTDDAHAIRDVATGRRLNGYGGSIVIDRHVWLGESVRVLGGARIGADSVVGMGSLVKTTVLPPNSVSVGVPARPIKFGVTWSREDLP